jgi:hypothetical protein
MSFTSFTATNPNGSTFTANGRLQVRPALVRPGATARLYWNVPDAQSCTVTGTNGDSWSAIQSPTAGRTTSALTAMTRYTLNCTAYAGVTPATIQDTATVLLSPEFSEN